MNIKTGHGIINSEMIYGINSFSIHIYAFSVAGASSSPPDPNPCPYHRREMLSGKIHNIGLKLSNTPAHMHTHTPACTPYPIIIFQTRLHTRISWRALKILIPGFHSQRVCFNWLGEQPGALRFLKVPR